MDKAKYIIDKQFSCLKAKLDFFYNLVYNYKKQEENNCDTKQAKHNANSKIRNLY